MLRPENCVVELYDGQEWKCLGVEIFRRGNVCCTKNALVRKTIVVRWMNCISSLLSTAAETWLIRHKTCGAIVTTGWWRPIGCVKLQVSFRKRATNYRALLRKMTYKDKATCASPPTCSRHHFQWGWKWPICFCHVLGWVRREGGGVQWTFAQLNWFILLKKCGWCEFVHVLPGVDITLKVCNSVCAHTHTHIHTHTNTHTHKHTCICV